MRDSNHSFPSLNRACVSISSSLYDRRAIDSPVPTLPLLTSLQHLAYLTSTSPRIREILTVDGGLERLISIVETCIDIAYPERARKGRSPSIASSSSASSSSSSSSSSGPSYSSSASSYTSQPSRPSSSDRKGKQRERHAGQDEHFSSDEATVPSPPRRIVPFKAFSAYANYPFTLDTDSDETTTSDEDTSAMDLTPSHEDGNQAILSSKAQRSAMTAHEREVRLLELERSFMRNFMNEYKDLPALVHTYGFALQCLVNVGVRGSESIRTRVVEAGVLGVVARILGGFLDYRATERDKRQKIIQDAHDEKEKEKELSISINGPAARERERRERDRDRHGRITSNDSDSTAVLTMSTRRERRERDLAAAAAAAALASAHGADPQHQQQTRDRGSRHFQTPLVAGMPIPINAQAASSTASATSTTPRQTRSAAVQALLNSSTEVPTLAPRQYASAIIPPSSLLTATATRTSPRRLINLTNTSSSSSPAQVSAVNAISSSNSLIAGSILINRTNTPDTIASIDEVQEFSDVIPDETESTTSSGQENDDADGTLSSTITLVPGMNMPVSVDTAAASGEETVMDIVEAAMAGTETDQQSTSAMMIASSLSSNPASRSVSRNRINGNVLAQHRPVPPPSSSSAPTASSRFQQHHLHRPHPHHVQHQHQRSNSASEQGDLSSTTAVVEAPNMLGDVTIKLDASARAGVAPPSRGMSTDDNSTENEEDVVMHGDDGGRRQPVDREDQESTDDTGTSASPVSRPTSSMLRHHQHLQQRHHQQQERVEYNASSSGIQMDSETTPISRPIPLRTQSSSHVAASGPATPRNAFVSAQNLMTDTAHQEAGSLASFTANIHSHVEANHLRSQAQASTAQGSNSSSSRSRTPHTSTHVHLRLHPQLQQASSAQPSVLKDGHVHLLLNYGPLMDHYIKEEDVLHCLHLLAYLSKYPHVRAVFHDPENEIIKPPSAGSAAGEADTTRGDVSAATAVPDVSMASNTDNGDRSGNRGNCCSCARKKLKLREGQGVAAVPTHQDSGAATSSSASAASLSGAEDATHVATASSSACDGHCHAHARAEDDRMVGANANTSHSRSTSSGSQKHSHPCCSHEDGDHDGIMLDEEAESLARARAMATMPAKDRKPALEPSRPPRSTANNVFSLVEQYTFRPSSPADRSMRLGADIQYWAGVIMRNACRKDELRGGIRQCANMGCGVWERFPREFAKCRRCRKAKYCSKGCQRRAWQAGHRYWCSARQDAPPAQAAGAGSLAPPATDNVVVQMGTNNADDEDDDVDVDEARLRGGAGGGQTVNPAIVANNVGGPPGGPGNIMDGITVGGDDDGMNVEVGGDRFDHQRIRMGGGDGNGEMGMLDAM